MSKSDFIMHETTLPIGPVHPMMKEPEYLKIQISGEEIKDVEVYMGYSHKGIEKLVEQRNWYQSIFAVERICGICGIVHTSSFVTAVEKIQELQVPARANYIRGIMNEFERIHSHLLWLGLEAYQLGFETLFMHILGTRETVMNLVEGISGNRVHYGTNTIGGVRRDIKKSQFPKILDGIKTLRRETQEIKNIFLSDKIIDQRLRGVGVLSLSAAKRLGAVGPVARGSGYANDVRSRGYFCYKDVDFKPIERQKGDCLARLEVRLDELLESYGMIERMLDQMPNGEINIGKRFMKINFGEALGSVEAPRGEVIHYVVSKGDVSPFRDKVRSPTYANLLTLGEMLKGETIADAAVIIDSIDPCWSCTDRALVVNEDTGKNEVVDLSKINRGSEI